MQTQLRGKDFICTQDWTVDELNTALDVAVDLKRKFALGEPTPYLSYKTLYMLFFFASTRTRNSFETGITQLGGHGIFLDPSKTQISHGENAKDTGTILSRYGDGIAIRQCDWMEGNQYVNDMAKYSTVPVINMQCDQYHPCQIMADYMTIREKFGRNTKGLKIGVAWTSAPNYVRPISVPQSLILMMPRFGMDVTLAIPPEFKLMPEVMKQAEENAKVSGAKFEVTDDFDAAFQDAHVVIPKSWGPLLTTTDKAEGLKLIEKYPSWRCEKKHMDLCDKDGVYMHPLPADRGREVTDEVIDGPRSVVYDEAENRLHVQKAIMALTMGGRP
ncbi:ornithine carbamoyltransferase [bacterium]|nr:ornithine carbamoyltransferase [bacterium]